MAAESAGKQRAPAIFNSRIDSTKSVDRCTQTTRVFSAFSCCGHLRSITTDELVHSKLHRVKRLLHYAGLLPPLDESARVDSNRVMGCTAQIWAQVKYDGEGKMRLASDSDSEITKGFCSCLIWLLNGSTPDEVLKVKTDGLVALNVGLPSTEPNVCRKGQRY
ncbi:hypothetical protein L6164_032785 [Bauhinia variegata]|uniref:Uncharacterized protein n=1 Tax=Bauhinia variegata TaxID=167791 RepID=A0ACB9KPW4_BAUVA|nr:hypothetical protein L6164_032785 [Bauhinia variegata]